MIRVVADTNVYISALMFGGLPGKFLDLAFSGSFLLTISLPLLDELNEKLRTKFAVSITDMEVIHTKLENVLQLVSPDMVLDIVKDDPDNNRVLECAVAAEVEYVVSGDRHLLKLGSYEGIPVLTVRQFLNAVAFG